MIEWRFCPVCSERLSLDKESNPACPEGHFTKYPNPVAATAAFIQNNGEYLLIKRAREPQKGWWDLPGGFIEYDEKADESLLREIEEETGLVNLKIEDFLGGFPGNYAGIQKVLDLVFVIKSYSREVRLSGENNEYKWVELSDIPELAFEDLNEALKLLKKRML